MGEEVVGMIDVALSCIDRGWFVFPCKARGKFPQIRKEDGGRGYHDAVNDEAQVRAWWAKWPNANVGIATGASGLTVLDIDHGIDGPEALGLFSARGLPETYTVRTGRRPGYGVQLYYQTGEPLKSIAWVDPIDGVVRGDVRGGSGYVLAAGSLHPSGAFYEALVEAPIAPVPDFVRGLKPAPVSGVAGGTNPGFADDGGPIIGSRNVKMASVLGRLRAEGYDDDRLREAAEQINETRVQPPLAEWELDRVVSNICKYPIPEAEPVVIIGKGQAPAEPLKHWTERYLTFEQVRDAPPTTFHITGFLAVGSITALAAPVGQRKSLIAMNVAASLLTGRKLFGHFKVDKMPERVVYLCPEMGVSSFSNRLKGLDLLEYVGKSLFCQTMDEESFGLDVLDEELPGAVVIIDTLTRFVDGDQNRPEDMAKFAAVCFGLKRRGATILLLHHSRKGAGAEGLNLDTAMRGSSELAAFVTSCWATKLVDPELPYKSLSLIANVKQRDFESAAFHASSDKDGRMSFQGEVILGSSGKVKSSDAETEKASEIIRANPTAGVLKLRSMMAEVGIKRAPKWVTALRAEVLDGGVKHTESAP